MSSSSEKQAINLMARGKGRQLQVVNANERQHLRKYIKFLDTEKHRFRKSLEKDRNEYFSKLRNYYSKLYSKFDINLERYDLSTMMWIQAMDLEGRDFKSVEPKASSIYTCSAKLQSSPSELPSKYIFANKSRPSVKNVEERQMIACSESSTEIPEEKSFVKCVSLNKSSFRKPSYKKVSALSGHPKIQTTKQTEEKQRQSRVRFNEEEKDKEQVCRKNSTPTHIITTQKQFSLASIPSCLKTSRHKVMQLRRHKTIPNFFASQNRFDTIPEEHEEDEQDTGNKMLRLPVVGEKQNIHRKIVNSSQSTVNLSDDIDEDYYDYFDTSNVYKYNLPPIYQTQQRSSFSPPPPFNTPDSLSAEFEKLKNCRYLRKSIQF